METFSVFLEKIEDSNKRNRMTQILEFISKQFPHLKQEIKWNQPMFTDHGTFIIGFSVSKKHIALAPEAVVLDYFEDDIAASGYLRTKELMMIPWQDEVNLDLIHRIVAYNIESKKNSTHFWKQPLS